MSFTNPTLPILECRVKDAEVKTKLLYQTLSRIIKDYLYYFLANLGIQPIVKLYAITAIKCGRTRFYDQYQFKLEL